MPLPVCPKGHESVEPDFCSVCGARLVASAAPIGAAEAITIDCPDCAAPHPPDSGIFCEVCGYNFSTAAHGELHVAPVAAPPAVPQPEPVPQAWEVTVAVDPTLQAEGSPAPLTSLAPITIALSKETNFIGRTSEKRAIAPEIPLDHDDAVSHRHALLSRQPDGTFTLRDLESSNGTWINGIEIKPLTDIPLKNGDEFTLGHWTRITLKAISL